MVFLACSADFLTFVVTTGKRNPQGQKVSSSPQENLDNFLTADEQSSLVCINATRHCAYRQDLFIAVPPVQRVLWNRQGSCLFI